MILIWLIKKKIEESPRRWHEVLFQALWAHRVSKHGATKVTPFELVFGQEVVLPVEVNMQRCRVEAHDALSTEQYHELMMDRIDEVINDRCDRTTSGRGTSTRISLSDSRWSENTINTYKYNTKLHWSSSISYYNLGLCFKFTKGWRPKDASKDITEFAEAISLTFRTFSSP
jgi:hypothetical protein